MPFSQWENPDIHSMFYAQSVAIQYCKFLDPLKHNWINLVNKPSYYLVQIPDLG